MTPLPTNFANNVGMVVDADYLNDLGEAVNAGVFSGTFASRPAAAAGNAGAHYFCTDCDAVYKSDGSAWTKIRCAGLGAPGLGDPPSSGLSTTTMGSATVSADLDGRVMVAPNASGDNWRVEYKALSPTSNYTARALFRPRLQSGTFCSGGLVLFESSSGKLISFNYNLVSGTWTLVANKYTNATTFSAQYATTPMGILTTGSDHSGYPPLLQIRDDGTNRHFEYSFTGEDWQELGSGVSRTDFLTPSHIGWGLNNNSGATARLRCRSLKIF